jgi:ATP-dependent Clp protease ATP-binding subunit ClpA
MNWFKSKDIQESYSNFTPRAQQVMALAREQANRFHHNFVGTEHLLLGLISLGQGVAANVLAKFGLSLDNVRLEVEKQIGQGTGRDISGSASYTPRVKKVLALAAKEARALNHTYVGTEHILLGLLREGDGVAARVMKNLGVDIEHTRQEIIKELVPNFQFGAKVSNPSELPQNADLQNTKLASIDTSKRYDVFCSEDNQNVVIYRNVLFKGRSKLMSTRHHDIGSEFLELEQSNGKTVYLSLLSVRKFCEQGVDIISEIIPPK